MKKIYSFVLMAAMLLVGTSAWAETVTVTVQATDENPSATFENAWNQSATKDVVIILQNEEVSISKTLWLGTENMNDAAHSVEIRLNGNPLTLGTQAYGFLLTHGTLKITGPGTIDAACATNVFYVLGSTNKDVNPRSEGVNYFSHLEIGAGVIVNHSAYNAAISVDEFYSTSAIQKAQSGYAPSKPALSYITNVYSTAATKAGYGVAHGVRVDLYGTIHAQKYAIKTNGILGSPTGHIGSDPSFLPQGAYTIAAGDTAYAPFIYVHPGAKVDVADKLPDGQDVKKQPLALYASGYARWKIEGEAKGNVGLMVKSGDVDLNNATIISNAPTNDPNVVYAGPNNGTSGSSAVGSAIVINSADAYAGDIDITITGTTTVTAGLGLAIDEQVKTNADETKVDAIKIESGTFDGGEEGTIAISEVTVNAANPSNPASQTTIIVTSATIDGPVQFGDNTGLTLDNFTSGSAVIPDDPAHPDKGGVVVPLTIRPTNDNFASYSAPVDLVLPAGLKAYTGVVDGDELKLNQVSYVKANQGIILYGADDQYQLLYPDGDVIVLPTPTDDDNNNYYNNELKPSSAWTGNSGSIFCLRYVDQTLFYKYTGDIMPANKAYLDLADAPAPQRIRLVITETQDVENVEFEAVKVQKFIENGQVLIKRGENIYNVQGQIVK